MTADRRPARRVRIRAARVADTSALAALRWEFRAALDRASEPRDRFVPRCERWMRERLRRGTGWRCWVAEVGGEVRGMVWLAQIEKLPNPSPSAEPEAHAYVTSLYVRPAERGRGAGSSLLAEALRACGGGGTDAVFLWPTPRSRSLYRRHGFAPPADLLERDGSSGSLRPPRAAARTSSA